MLSLTGRNVLITGAAGAIGRATAQLFQGLGASLFLTDRDPALLRALADELGTHGKVGQLAGDVTVRSQVNAIRAAFERELGRADALVLAAGIYRPARLVDMTDDEWSTMLDVNLGGTFSFCRAFAPSLSDGSTIVMLSSIAAHRGSVSFGHYSASKSGLLGLMRSLALELAPRTRVNAVSPGPVDSPMVAPLIAARGPEIIAQTPLKRLATTDEVAKTIAFLSSDWSSFITGENIHVNGGLYMA